MRFFRKHNAWLFWALVQYQAITMIAIGEDGRIPPEPLEKPLDQTDKTETLARYASFMEPPAYERAPKLGRITLTMGVAENILNGKRLRHLSYNGGLVGPTIRVQPGDTIEMRVENRVTTPLLQLSSEDPHGPHGLYSTNLHPHGLHITPQGESDNSFIRLDPGNAFTFRFSIPADHPAGTYWYHPHKHGGVAYQLTNGLAGALIVEGDFDWTPELRGVRERVLVFQQFIYRQGPDGVQQVYPEDIYSGEPPSSSAPPVAPTFDTAINGVVTPLITLHPGEVQRWRMIHAGVNRSIKLNIEKIDGSDAIRMHEIAVDGIPLGKVAARDFIWLNPGYRSDVLVQIPEEGTYLLYTEIKEAEKDSALNLAPVERTYVAKIYVSGEKWDMQLPPPNAFAAFKPKQRSLPPGRNRTIEFNLDPDNLQYNVDGREFDISRIDHFVQLGTVEEWTLVSRNDNHPFHIHVNPFQVVEPGVPPEDWVWRDTLMVLSGQTLKIRMEFNEFDGRTVMHCHNLDHEDQGMMQQILISKDAAGDERRQQQTQAARLQQESAPPPATLPSARLLDTAGREFDSAQLAQRKTILIFHRGVGCPHCASQIATLAASAAELERLGYQIAAIAPGEPSPAEAAFAEKFNIRFPLLSDPGAGFFRALGLLRTDAPALHAAYLVGPGGAIEWSATGESPVDAARVLEAAKLFSTAETQTANANP